MSAVCMKSAVSREGNGGQLSAECLKSAVEQGGEYWLDGYRIPEISCGTEKGVLGSCLQDA